jgi:hypothetical protein
MPKKPLSIEVDNDSYNPTMLNLINEYFKEPIIDFAIITYYKLEKSNNKLQESNNLPTSPENNGVNSPKSVVQTKSPFCEFTNDDSENTIKKKVFASEIKIGDKFEKINILELTLKKNIKENKFTKMYKIDNKDNFSYLSILREIVLHYYAIELKKNNCNSEIIIPEIQYINKIDCGEFTTISITMDYMDIVDLNDSDLKIIINNEENWKPWYKNITNLLNCFEANGLFHNDTHVDNLTFIKDKEKNIKLALFDFGKSTFREQLQPSRSGFTKGEYNEQQFNRWLNHINLDHLSPYELYGGKPKKISRKNSKTSKKQKKRKNKKRKTSKKPKY